MLQTFLRAIAEDPEDLASRRALADWLMEQGDVASQERGEFIAAQLEIGAGARRARRKQLEQRERELLARYRDEWTRELLATGVHRRCLFRNGMVEGIEADADVFALAAEERRLFSLAPITEL